MGLGVGLQAPRSALERWISSAVDRALDVVRVDDAQISPGGTLVAFTLSRQWRYPGAPANSAIYVVSASGGDPALLATGHRSCQLPRWRPWSRKPGAPADRTLSFVKILGADCLVCIEDIARGRGQTLARFSEKVEDLQWSPDGRYLAVLLTEDPRMEGGGETDVVRGDADEPWTRLWVIEVASGHSRPVSPPGVQIWEFAWAPDSAGFAVVAADAPGEGSWYRTRLATLSLDGEMSAPLYATQRQIVRPTWSPDGSALAFLSCLLSDRDMGSGDIWVVSPSGAGLRNLTEGYTSTPTWIDWLDSNALVVLGYEDCDSMVATLTVTGTFRQLWRGPVALGHHRWPRVSLAGGRWPLAVTRESAHEPQEVWIAEPATSDGLRWRQLTHLHAGWAGWPLGEAEFIRWEARDGQEIQAILFLPPGAGLVKPLPLVTAVHGGPTNLWSWRSYLLWHRLLTMLGCAVFLPNPRGSTGRGVSFAEANLRDYGGEDWQDILAGIEALTARGTADPGRLGIGGWSYGGFMSAWAITQTQRLGGAVVGAGISNWVSFHGTTPLHAWDAANLGDPYRDALPAQRSPLAFLNRVKTPTLIVHGLADRVVPPGQAQELFRGLRHHGVTAEMFLYPREPHFFTERDHLHHLYSQILSWFARHLGLTEDAITQTELDGGDGNGTG